MEEKIPLPHEVLCFLMLDSCVENYSSLENYVTSEGAVTHNVLYYQPLSISRYQKSFHAKNYF